MKNAVPARMAPGPQNAGVDVPGAVASGPAAPARASSGAPLATSPALERLRAFPRVELGRWPTPIQRLSRSDGRALLVKRDDLSGHGRGGAKARKIEHVVGHMRAHGFDELVTVAGNVTNVVFDLLPALDRFGLGARILILDDPPASAADRAEIFRAVRRRVRLLGRSRSAAALRALAEWSAAPRRGRRAFLAPPGLSHPAAVVGNACGFLEMAEQLLGDGRVLPRAVYVSAATGTTVAGFLLAEAALREAGAAPIRVVGVQVYPGWIGSRVVGLIRWTEHALGLGRLVPTDRIEIDRSALAGGFARFGSDLSTLCERVESEAGFRIDPIFGGKTWSVLELDEREAETGVSGRPVLYWHCGYTPEWPALARRLR